MDENVARILHNSICVVCGTVLVLAFESPWWFLVTLAFWIFKD